MSSTPEPHASIPVSSDGDENKVEPSTPTDEGSLRSIWTDGEGSEGEEETESEDDVKGKAKSDAEEMGEVREVGEEKGQEEAAEGEALDHVGTDCEHNAAAPVGLDGEHKASSPADTDGEGQVVAPVGNNPITPAQVGQQQSHSDVQVKEPAEADAATTEADATTEASATAEADAATGPATDIQVAGANGIQERELGPSGRRYHLRSMAERKRQLWGKEDI